MSSSFIIFLFLGCCRRGVIHVLSPSLSTSLRGYGPDSDPDRTAGPDDEGTPQNGSRVATEGSTRTDMEEGVLPFLLFLP